MQPVRLALVVLLLSASTLLFGQNKEDWLPLTDQDFQTVEVPGERGAAAIQLYYANYIDENSYTEFVYHRIKVLNEGGKQYADVEIPLRAGADLSNLKARTIHPDRTIVEFTGKPFQKTVFKGHGVKISTRAFTLPEVTVGSIIEYKYKLHWSWSETWVLQHDLYTVRERLTYQPAELGGRLHWVGRNITGPEPAQKNGIWETEWHNVPAFEAEANMPPERNYKPTIHFYTLDYDIKTTEKYWEEVGKILNNFYHDAIGNRKEVKEAALTAIGNETDPEKKLRKLYDRAQQIRNLSYEKERSKQEMKKEKIKENHNIGDILKRGYGDDDDITALFVGMARAAGFDASLLWVSNRRDEFFSDKLLSLGSLSDRMARVKLNGKDIFLQPGVPYCPFGLLSWFNTSTQALTFDKKGGTFVTVPALSYMQSTTRRRAKLELSDDGSGKGELTVEFRGEEALERRLGAIDSDDAGRKKDLEDEVRGWLPDGATVKLIAAQGWDSPNDPLTAKFNLDLPSYATVAGKRLMIPALLFRPRKKDAFTHTDRKYPVYYHYPFGELDRVEVKLPAGYAAESIPQKKDLGVDYARYLSMSVCDGKYLVSERGFTFNALFIELSKYPELKDFMAKVNASDDQQAVMKLQAQATAQSPN